MAKQVFIAVLLLVAFFAAPTHETTPSVEKEKATPRKLVGEFKDQTVVVEKLIKLPRGVMVPNQVSCFPDRDFDLCPPECICVANPGPPISSTCVCPYTPTRETIESVKAAAATPIEMVEKFQDHTVEKQKLNKLPQGVMVPNGNACPCDPECICVVEQIGGPTICVCPYTPTHETIASVKAAAAATPKEMVENFQDRTVEKLIKLPQGVMVPNGDACYPPYFDQCDPDCICVANLPYPPVPGVCICPYTKTHETIPSGKARAATPKKLVGEFKDQTVVEKLIKLPRGVMVPNQDGCYPPYFDQCPPDCICVANLPEPPIPGICANMKNKEMEGYLRIP